MMFLKMLSSTKYYANIILFSFRQKGLWRKAHDIHNYEQWQIDPGSSDGITTHLVGFLRNTI